MAFGAACRSCVLHRMAGPAEPVCRILAESGYLARVFAGLAVAVLAITFEIGLMFAVGEAYAVFETERFRVVSGKCSSSNEDKRRT